MDKVKQFFKDYPTAKAVYTTSDGYLFWKEADAKEHAKKLEDKEVKVETKVKAKEDDKAKDDDKKDGK